MRPSAKFLTALALVAGIAAQSAFAITCQDDTLGGGLATNCVGCISYILQAGLYYRACSPSVPCTDQNTFNYLANRCAQQYQQCQIQCCTTEKCNAAQQNPIPNPQPVPNGPGGPIVIVSAAPDSRQSLLLSAPIASVLALALARL